MGQTVLVVDDTDSSLFMLRAQLKEWDFTVLTSRTGVEALEILKRGDVDLVLSDQVMPGMDGLVLLHAAKELYPDLPFIILTAHGSISTAVASIRKGADDYLEKPYHRDELRAAIERSLSYSRLKKDHRELTEYLSSLHGFQAIITRSTLVGRVLAMARKVADSPTSTVAIYGESGTGKELLARAIHTASGNIDSRFVAVNCAAIPGNLLESELFGHVKGAFTGADRDREGKFGLASQGTLLLDEIGDMPLDLQAKLLRVLEERQYAKVGGNKLIASDFRVIATTNRDLPEMVAAGSFRADLYHRISMFPLTIPPLRERAEDIPLLVDHFLGKFRSELGKHLPGVSRTAMNILQGYSWPGNIRELKNCLERAAILSDEELIGPDHLSIGVSGSAVTVATQHSGDTWKLALEIPRDQLSLDTVVKRTLQIVLEQCGGNKSQAAKLLHVDRKTFYRRR